jgi:putative phosphoribosyl transferase
MAHDRIEPRPIGVAAQDVELAGDLTLPDGAPAIVLFAHGSGSPRRSGRTRFVARQLAQAGLATLVLDLLTPMEEEEDRWSGELRLDIGLLADRLGAATEFVRAHPATRGLALGYLGASTGAAAALVAAAERPDAVRAVAARGGRPELAGDALERVAQPTLLIVGSEDREALEQNESALRRLRCESELATVAGAGRLFEEPGALADVAALAGAWFVRHLVERPRPQAEPQPLA